MSPVSMQHTRTIVQDDGPNHLGLWVQSDAPGAEHRGNLIGGLVKPDLVAKVLTAAIHIEIPAAAVS